MTQPGYFTMIAALVACGTLQVACATQSRDEQEPRPAGEREPAMLTPAGARDGEQTQDTPPASQGGQGELLTQRAAAKNAAPLGLEIGYANLRGARDTLGRALREVGVNEYSRGPMFRLDGAESGVPDLKHALLIFSPDEVLQGVVMTFPKDPKGTLPLLKKKYTLVSDRVDSFMNRGSAQLEKGDSVVQMEAPHLSFEMTIQYLSKAFEAEFHRVTEEKAQAEKAHKHEKL